MIIDSDAGDPFVVVDTDQEQGTRLVTQHLLDLGHTAIVHVAGPSTSYSAARRAAEWRATMLDAGLQPEDPAQGDWTTASGYRIGKELGQRADITGIVAANDQMALGIMHALHELGREVPGDISVVGFDDTEESSSFWPPLTTVHQDFTEIGRRSMQVLLEMLDGREPSGDRIVPTRLVVRESAAAPRATRADPPPARGRFDAAAAGNGWGPARPNWRPPRARRRPAPRDIPRRPLHRRAARRRARRPDLRAARDGGAQGRVPGARITLLGTPLHRALLAGRPGGPDEIEVLPVAHGVRDVPGTDPDPAEIEAFAARMRARRFDLAMQVHGAAATPTRSCCGSARHTVGTATDDAERLERVIPYVYYQHEVLRGLEVAGSRASSPTWSRSSR